MTANSLKFLLAIILIVLTGCYGSNGGCEADSPIIDFEVSNWFNPNHPDANNQEYHPAIFYIAPLSEPKHQYTSNITFSPFNRAEASSCDPPYFEEDIVEINIYSDNDFGPGYPSGTQLNQLFFITEDHLYRDGLTEHLPSILPLTRMSLGFYRIFFHLTELPQTRTNHRFTIELLLSNGAQHEVRTAVIDFQAEKEGI